MIFTIVGLSLISYSISSIITKQISNKKQRKAAILELEMMELLKNNHYISLEEWKNGEEE